MGTSVSLFQAENITRMPGRAASCLLPAELASATVSRALTVGGAQAADLLKVCLVRLHGWHLSPT